MKTFLRTGKDKLEGGELGEAGGRNQNVYLKQIKKIHKHLINMETVK